MLGRRWLRLFYGASIVSALAALTGMAVGGLTSYSAALDLVWREQSLLVCNPRCFRRYAADVLIRSRSRSRS